MLILGVLVLVVVVLIALVVLSHLALCEIVSCASTKSPPEAEPGRCQRAPWRGSAPVGSGARGEERDGRSTRGVPGAPSSDLLLARADAAPRGPSRGLGWGRQT